MTSDSATLFDNTLNSYHSLSTLALLTLHISIRFTTIHHLSLALTEESYLLPSPSSSSPTPSAPRPSTSILALNTALTTTDDIFATLLTRAAHTFLTTGLTHLADNLLVHHAASIGAMNGPGCDRIKLNILVAQQGLRNVEHRGGPSGAGGVRLAKASTYYGLFVTGVPGIVDAAKRIAEGKGVGDFAERYSYDELKTLMELCLSERLASDRREVGVAAKRELGEGVLGLSEVLWAS